MGGRGEKVHRRTIEVNTYTSEGNRIIVEGILKDERFQETHVPTGERFPAGVMHHMLIRLFIDSSDMKIADLEVEFLHVPRDFCRETVNCLNSLKGVQVAKGFSRKVKDLAGGVKGCAHLVELLQAMAPAVFQGVAAHRSRRPVAIDDRLLKIVRDRLVNTCYVWREGGPLASVLQNRLRSFNGG